MSQPHMKNWLSATTPNDSLLGLLYYVELQPEYNVLQVLNETNQVNKGPFSGCDTYMYVFLWAEADRKWMWCSLSIWSIPSNLSNFSDWSQFLQSCLYDQHISTSKTL